MWQSKKNHTSFVKSFLHHESAEAEHSNQDPAIQENKQENFRAPAKGQKGKAGAFVHELISPSSLDEEEMFLKVLGI